MYSKLSFGMKDVCQLLGVSSSTIRIYERFLTRRQYEVLDSGHRKLTGASFAQLYDLRSMSRMGLSIKEAVETCQANNTETRIQMCVKGEQRLMMQLQYLKAVLHEIREVKSCFNMLGPINANFALKTVPGFFYLECERDGKLLDDPDEANLVKAWAAKIPAVYYINRDVMEDPNGSEWSYRVGLAISDENASLVPIDHKAVIYVPARTCVTGVIVDENSESLSCSDYRFSGKCLSYAMDYLRKNNLKLADQVFHRMVGSMLTVKDAKGRTLTGDLWYGIYPVE